MRELQNAVERELIVSHGQPLSFANLESHGAQNVNTIAPKLDSASVSLDKAISMHILKTLELTGGKVEGPNGAARMLEINPSTLRKKMRKLGIPFGRSLHLKA